ncbi:MAG: hypothetical protein ACJ8LN_15805, partial [Sulfurifustis sp.]
WFFEQQKKKSSPDEAKRNPGLGSGSTRATLFRAPEAIVSTAADAKDADNAGLQEISEAKITQDARERVRPLYLGGPGGWIFLSLR